ncbi:hypothetical protein F3Y22_tig00112249pilonHSYRG00315 [Hibiscus syriacus]|uniref:Leucine-rich repeat-containing N-terminal plant-type domain-containing protein n=1 Tax=Hibiscus syriacus TaxID=106335 RepID=A0A6A2X338_HIBSY|nr:hypothetical protein F3Y22_tig00112249pilonHSYRG00315 [Hibiscus syriacus]
MLMELSKTHMVASTSLFLVYIKVITLSCFSLQGLNLLGLAIASPVIRGNGTDQQALLQFEAKITGDQLRIMEPWNSSFHFCQWRGVTGGRNHQRVTKLELQSLKLSGSLSPFIGNLSFLREPLVKPGSLKPFQQQFKREHPTFLGELVIPEDTWFVHKWIKWKCGTIPYALGQLKNLLQFTFLENSISGIIPVAMFNLSNIEVFDIGYNKIQGRNQISGKITISISNASNLYELQIGGNRLTGNVPSLEKLDKLVILHVGINHLGYGREEGIGNLINLEILWASINQISGPIPFEIGRLQKLKIFSAHSNFLYGAIPSSVGNLTVLIGLNLDGNNLKGNIPSRLGVLDVSQNRLSGLLPNNLGSCTSLVKLLLNDNWFEGPIPASLSSLRGLEALDVYDHNLSCVIPELLVIFGALKYLNLSFNDFEWVIPS